MLLTGEETSRGRSKKTNRRVRGDTLKNSRIRNVGTMEFVIPLIPLIHHPITPSFHSSIRPHCRRNFATTGLWSDPEIPGLPCKIR
jgi:hypothetical protein